MRSLRDALEAKNIYTISDEVNFFKKFKESNEEFYIINWPSFYRVFKKTTTFENFDHCMLQDFGMVIFKKDLISILNKTAQERYGNLIFKHMKIKNLPFYTCSSKLYSSSLWLKNSFKSNAVLTLLNELSSNAKIRIINIEERAEIINKVKIKLQLA